jgi:hypothetical protein
VLGTARDRAGRWWGRLRVLTPNKLIVPAGASIRPPVTSEWHARLHGALENLRAKRSATEIADRYLSFWGGLADGLPLLAADPTLGDVDGGNGLRNLVPLLLTAGRDEDVHRLLACEEPAGVGRPGVVNVWFDVRHRVGDVDGYLQDLKAAHRRVREATDADIAAGRRPASLGLEMRYTLMKHCAESAGERVDDELAAMLTETGIWNTTRRWPTLSCRHPTRCITTMSPRLTRPLGATSGWSWSVTPPTRSPCWPVRAPRQTTPREPTSIFPTPTWAQTTARGSRLRGY